MNEDGTRIHAELQLIRPVKMQVEFMLNYS